MRKHFLLLCGLSLCTGLTAAAQTNLVTNGDFETQYATPPSQEDNVKSYNATVLSTNAVDELPNWRSVRLPVMYMASNASLSTLQPANSPYGSFAPHSGQGCVRLNRSTTNAYDRTLLTQQITIQANTTYNISFYARHNAYAPASVGEKIGVYFTASQPNHSSTYSPAYNASFVSNPIPDNQSWTHVTGTITTTEAASYVVICFEIPQIVATPGPTEPRAAPQAKSTEQARHFKDMMYVVDDVEISVQPTTPSPCVSYEMQEPIWTCATQDERYFAINGTKPGLTYVWEFYRIDPATGGYGAPMPTVGSSSCNTTNPKVRINPTRWGNGDYFYRTRVTGTTPAGVVCNTGWREGGLFVINSSNCTHPYDPQDDEPLYRTASQVTNGGGMEVATQLGTTPTQAYPNPATETVTLPKGVSQAVLLNSQGLPVQQVDKTGTLDVRNLPAGLYNLRIMQQGKTVNQRIQVQH